MRKCRPGWRANESVAKRPKAARAVLAPAASRDIREIRRWSELEFGRSGALRYQTLLEQVLSDIEADPERPGSKERPDMVAGARIYHFSFNKDRVLGEKVKSPRHLVVYRRRRDGALEIARILHDARDLPRHLPGPYRVRKTRAN